MHRAIIIPAFLAVLATAFAADFSSECQRQWRQWRGPLANGTAPHGDPPVQWSETKNVKWKVPIPGEGSATPIVWGDQVFIVAAVRTDRTLASLPKPEQEPPGGYKTERPKYFYWFEVLSLDRQTGTMLWQRTATESGAGTGECTRPSRDPGGKRPVRGGRPADRPLRGNGGHAESGQHGAGAATTGLRDQEPARRLKALRNYGRGC